MTMDFFQKSIHTWFTNLFVSIVLKRLQVDSEGEFRTCCKRRSQQWIRLKILSERKIRSLPMYLFAQKEGKKEKSPLSINMGVHRMEKWRKYKMEVNIFFRDQSRTSNFPDEKKSFWISLKGARSSNSEGDKKLRWGRESHREKRMKSRNFFNAVRKKVVFSEEKKLLQRRRLWLAGKKQEDLSKKRKNRVLPSPFYFQLPLGLSATYEHCFPEKKRRVKSYRRWKRERDMDGRKRGGGEGLEVRKTGEMFHCSPSLFPPFSAAFKWTKGGGGEGTLVPRKKRES